MKVGDYINVIMTGKSGKVLRSSNMPVEVLKVTEDYFEVTADITENYNKFRFDLSGNFIRDLNAAPLPGKVTYTLATKEEINELQRIEDYCYFDDEGLCDELVGLMGRDSHIPWLVEVKRDDIQNLIDDTVFGIFTMGGCVHIIDEETYDGYFFKYVCEDHPNLAKHIVEKICKGEYKIGELYD